MRPSPLYLAAAALLAGSLAAGCGRSGGAAGPALTPEASAGAALIDAHNCRSCHSTDGKSGAGPTWKGLFSSQVTLRDGRTVQADASYLRRAVLDPDADIVAGYSGGLMASSIRGGKLSEQDADLIVAYLETVR